MDELGRYLNNMMGWVMLFTAHDMVKNFVEKVMEAEREKLTETLGHEPDSENWQYYRDLQWQKLNREKAHQREIDREKLRRLVFGEEEV
ncbi:MAG: hypothetical protein HYX80_09025 [Chloroflexi bacterium]|nr:hypothetical protein [Chloroflexota bacterium]